MLTALVAAVLLAQAAPEAPTPLASPALEQEARQLETMLIAPCCWSQQVSVHQSPAADEVRKDIRRRLSEGRTRQEILDAYVAQFGERILAEPPARGFARALYVLPIVLLILSVAVLTALVRRMARPARAVAHPEGAPADAYDERLNDELRDLD
jgi:cytochrome c-type biogenesis protein CcmH